MSYFDFLNEIEGNSPLSPNDKVIYNLSEEETNKYKEIKSEWGYLLESGKYRRLCLISPGHLNILCLPESRGYPS